MPQVRPHNCPRQLRPWPCAASRRSANDVSGQPWLGAVDAPRCAAARPDPAGNEVARLDHLGTNNCRRIAGSARSGWSEHATGNAIDVAAFVLRDGRRITILRDWTGGGPKASFLKGARTSACQVFGTVLSPDFNDAHADHLHLDQAQRGWGG